MKAARTDDCGDVRIYEDLLVEKGKKAKGKNPKMNTP